MAKKNRSKRNKKSLAKRRRSPNRKHTLRPPAVSDTMGLGAGVLALWHPVVALGVLGIASAAGWWEANHPNC